MKKKLLVVFLTGFAFLCLMGVSSATLYTIPLEQAISFQNEGEITKIDSTQHLLTLDGNYGPSTAGFDVFDYYATGVGARCLDAVSLSFDLSPVKYLSNVHSLTLRFFLQTGDYALRYDSGLNSHHYQILEGAFNSFNQDLGPNVALNNLSFDYDAYKDGGWLEASIDPSWIASTGFDLTLRLWNARLDAVELDVTNSEPIFKEEPSNVPEPASFLLMGLGLIGLAGLRNRRKIKK